MTLVRGLLLAAGLCLLAGCSSRPRGQAAPELTVLQDVNGLLHSAAGAGRPPANLADLARYESMYPQAYAKVKSGDVVVLWRTPLQGEGESGKGEVVVAYEKGVPTDGGYVLLSAGTVKKMSASEFASARGGK
jgi:hypothetical protein